MTRRPPTLPAALSRPAAFITPTAAADAARGRDRADNRPNSRPMTLIARKLTDADINDRAPGSPR